MAGFQITAAHGQLAINSVNLNGPAWRIQNFGALMSMQFRGESLVITRAAGRKARRRWVDEAVIGVEMLVRGDANSSGAAITGTANQLDQLYDNLVALEAVALPPSNETGYTATLTLPNATSRTAAVFVQSWQVQPEPTLVIARVAFDLVVPAGRFT